MFTLKIFATSAFLMYIWPLQNRPIQRQCSDDTYHLYKTDQSKGSVQMIHTISTKETIPAFMAVALKARITVAMMTSWQRDAFVTQFTIETC